IPVYAAKTPQRNARKPEIGRADHNSKQSRVLAMLRSPAGSTIAAIMKITDWQQHTVRGFLAGVVRKRLKLKLRSKLVNDNRVYRIVGGSISNSKVRGPKRRSR